MNIRHTPIVIRLGKNKDLVDLYDDGVPAPSIFEDGVATWFIDGYAGTKVIREYISDITIKLLLITKGINLNDKPFNTVLTGNKPVYNLKMFKDMEDNRYHSNNTHYRSSNTDDSLFNLMKEEGYRLYNMGALNIGSLLAYGAAISDDANAVKQKAKSCLWWTNKYYTGGSVPRVFERNRTDNAILRSSNRSLYKYDLFTSYVKSIQAMGVQILDVSISKLSRVLSITRKTAKKYLTKYLYLSIYIGESFIRSIRGSAESHTHEEIEAMAYKICNTPGCNELIGMDRTHCYKHVSKHVEYNKHVRDKDRDRFYHSAKWKKKRAEMMEYYSGLCQDCLEDGSTVEANVIDHIKELSDGGDELDNDNLTALCHYHHNQKTNAVASDRVFNSPSDDAEDDYIYC